MHNEICNKPLDQLKMGWTCACQGTGGGGGWMGPTGQTPKAPSIATQTQKDFIFRKMMNKPYIFMFSDQIMFTISFTSALTPLK